MNLIHRLLRRAVARRRARQVRAKASHARRVLAGTDAMLARRTPGCTGNSRRNLK